MQLQERRDHIQNSSYLPRYKEIMVEEVPTYLEKAGLKGSQQIIARFRCGNEEQNNRYWEPVHLCRICNASTESIEHMRSDCKESLRCKMSFIRLLGQKGKGLQWMKRVLKERKEEEE